MSRSFTRCLNRARNQESDFTTIGIWSGCEREQHQWHSMSRDVIGRSRRVGVRGLNPRVSRESVSRVNVYVPKHKHPYKYISVLMMEQNERWTLSFDKNNDDGIAGTSRTERKKRAQRTYLPNNFTWPSVRQ